MIQIIVGGEIRQIPAGTSVRRLLALEQVEMPEYVSVSVNEEFVPGEAFDTHILQNGDTVEFLYFMGGGG